MGNLIELGAFSECLSISHQSQFGPAISGKHCLLKITPSIDLIQKIVSFKNVSKKV